jgi:hypothetical protein
MTNYQGGDRARIFSPEVTMSYWRKLHKPERSYLADWVIVAALVLALLLIVLGAR